MSKLNSLPQTIQTRLSSNIVLDDSVSVILKPPPRLLVLVSGEDMDNIDLTGQIWKIAKPRGLEVVLLALCSNFSQEAQLRRKLVTMAAIIRDETVRADFQIGYGNNWLTLTRQEWRPGDILACGSDKYIGLRGMLLSQALSSKFRSPVQVFSASYSSRRPMSKMMSSVVFWVGSICILSVFFWMGALVTQAGQDWLHTFLLSLCVLLEIGLLWIWNFLF